jgi:hypothetical protein
MLRRFSCVVDSVSVYNNIHMMLFIICDLICYVVKLKKRMNETFFNGRRNVGTRTNFTLRKHKYVEE